MGKEKEMQRRPTSVNKGRFCIAMYLTRGKHKLCISCSRQFSHLIVFRKTVRLHKILNYINVISFLYMIGDIRYVNLYIRYHYFFIIITRITFGIFKKGDLKLKLAFISFISIYDYGKSCYAIWKFPSSV